MGILQEDVVVIKEAKKEGENTVVTVNCPDKTGLGRDLCRVILLFGLSIARGDVSTDGKWCYLVFWVVGKPSTRWDLLKSLLLEVCPICSPADSEMYYYRPEFQQPGPSDVFLLKIWCFHDKKGLLHDVTKALCELELTIKRVKVSTAPDGRVLDLLFVIDKREMLHTKQRQQQTIDHLESALGGSIMSCEIELASPEATICAQGSSFLPIIEDLFCLELPVQHQNGYCGSSPVSVTVDNFLSPSHSLLQISCKDHKGLVYDIMRTLKDYNIQNCFCKLRARTCTSWSRENPGRRFALCERSSCKFWVWIDPPMCARSKNIIPGLINRKNEMEIEIRSLITENKALKKQLSELCKPATAVRRSEGKFGFQKVIITILLAVILFLLGKLGVDEKENLMELQ